MIPNSFSLNWFVTSFGAQQLTEKFFLSSIKAIKAQCEVEKAAKKCNSNFAANKDLNIKFPIYCYYDSISEFFSTDKDDFVFFTIPLYY